MPGTSKHVSAMMLLGAGVSIAYTGMSFLGFLWQRGVKKGKQKGRQDDSYNSESDSFYDRSETTAEQQGHLSASTPRNMVDKATNTEARSEDRHRQAQQHLHDKRQQQQQQLVVVSPEANNDVTPKAPPVKSIVRVKHYVAVEKSGSGGNGSSPPSGFMASTPVHGSGGKHSRRSVDVEEPSAPSAEAEKKTSPKQPFKEPAKVTVTRIDGGDSKAAPASAKSVRPRPQRSTSRPRDTVTSRARQKLANSPPSQNNSSKTISPRDRSASKQSRGRASDRKKEEKEVLLCTVLRSPRLNLSYGDYEDKNVTSRKKLQDKIQQQEQGELQRSATPRPSAAVVSAAAANQTLPQPRRPAASQQQQPRFIKISPQRVRIYKGNSC